MGSTISVLSLIFGIVGFCCGVIFGPIAIIFGAIGLRREEGRGLAIAGLILGIVSFVCWILLLIIFWAFFAMLLGIPMGVFMGVV